MTTRTSPIARRSLRPLGPLLGLALVGLPGLLSGCEPEAVEDEPDPFFVEPLTPPAEGEGFQLSTSAIAPAGEEIWSCEVISRLPAEGVFQYVNVAESRQTPGMHHADLMTLFYTGLDLPPGKYDCAELYTDYAELMESGVFVFTSQLAEDSFTLPEGVAAPLPSDSSYLYEVHYVNPTDEDIEVVSYLNAHTIPKDDVTESIYGNVNRDYEINIPAGATDHVEWTRCVFDTDVDILFLSSHTHELAVNFELFLFDGVETGDLIYENDDWHAPRVDRYDPLLHVPAGTGFEYRCHYQNPNDHEVNWGWFATDEMCQFGYVFVPGDSSITCDTVETSDGVILTEAPQ